MSWLDAEDVIYEVTRPASLRKNPSDQRPPRPRADAGSGGDGSDAE